MTAAEVVNPPPPIAVTDFPILIGAVIGCVLTSIMLAVAGKFDKSGGALTISLLITIGMLGAVSYCLIFTIPNDDITPSVVGGLTAGFGAVVAYWLGRAREGPPRD